LVVAYNVGFFFAFDSRSGALRWAYNHPPGRRHRCGPCGPGHRVWENELIKNGGASERELVGYVADDPRTQAAIAEYARRALGRARAAGAPAK
jgi:hypothetical protein